MISKQFFYRIKYGQGELIYRYFAVLSGLPVMIMRIILLNVP